MNWKLIRIIDSCLGIPLLAGMTLIGKLRRRPRSPSQTPGKVRRILLIKFWGIGNIFMLLPSIQALRATYPEAEIDFLTLDSNREALETTATNENVVTVETRTILRFIATWREAVTQLKDNGYDIIIDFEQFARFSALIAHQIGAGEIIGFSTSGQHRHRLFTRPIPYDNSIHTTRSFFSLVAAAGVALPLPTEIDLAGSGSLREKGQLILAESGIRQDATVVVMHIGTSDNFRERRWLPERYAALADHLIERHRARVIFTGLAEESFLIRETVTHLRYPEETIDLGGQLRFSDYFALITACDLVISADTAAVHLASAVNSPVVGLYGPNTPLLYGPWGTKGLALYKGLDCSPCITNFNAKIHTCRNPAGKGACMHAIGTADTLAAIEEHYFVPGAPCLLTKPGRDK